MTLKEQRAIDVSGLAYVLSDRLSGTVGGAWLLLVVPVRYLSVLFGVLVVLAALTSAVSPDVPLRNTTRVAGGVASETVGTAAGIGGLPLALVYQSRSGPEVRSTLAVAFFMGTVISLLALTLSGDADLSSCLRARTPPRALSGAVGRELPDQSPLRGLAAPNDPTLRRLVRPLGRTPDLREVSLRGAHCSS